MFERVRSSLQSRDDRRIVPLLLRDLPSVAPREWNFAYSEMVDAISSSPDLAWRVEGTSEYIVGGLWRRRWEIGSIEELHAKANRRRLLEHLAARLQDSGASLLILGTTEQSRNLSFYLSEGFVMVDEIVRYERRRPDVPSAEATVSIRPLLADDRPALLELDHAAFPWLWWNSDEEFSWYLNLTGVEAHVATEGNRVIGYTGFTVSGRQGHLDRLAVLPDHQGRGVGRALVCRTLACMARRRVERVALTTQADNYRSSNLYRALGFVRTEVKYPLYGLWLGESGAGARPQ